MDDSLSQKPNRRDILKAALTTGAYAAPLILSASVPATVSAQVSVPIGALTGTVTAASNGAPIAGATVRIGEASAITNASGVYTIANAPSGTQTVTTSAAGYITRTDSVGIAASGTTFSPSLSVGTGVGVQIVLNWGATPSDLDSHLTGPNGASRFEVYYGNTAPVAYASLDHDDTTSFGPETTTVTTVGGNFVAGDYHYFIHNYSGSPGFNSSAPNPSVTVNQNGAQIAQFSAASASGNQASAYWHVFNFTLAATPTGGIVITPVQTFVAATPSDGVPLPPK